VAAFLLVLLCCCVLRAAQRSDILGRGVRDRIWTAVTLVVGLFSLVVMLFSMLGTGFPYPAATVVGAMACVALVVRAAQCGCVAFPRREVFLFLRFAVLVAIPASGIFAFGTRYVIDNVGPVTHMDMANEFLRTGMVPQAGGASSGGGAPPVGSALVRPANIGKGLLPLVASVVVVYGYVPVYSVRLSEYFAAYRGAVDTSFSQLTVLGGSYIDLRSLAILAPLLLSLVLTPGRSRSATWCVGIFAVMFLAAFGLYRGGGLSEYYFTKFINLGSAFTVIGTALLLALFAVAGLPQLVAPWGQRFFEQVFNRKTPPGLHQAGPGE